MSGNRIGEVKFYNDRNGKATIQLVDEIHVGDTIHILGRFTDLRQKVTVLQVDDHTVKEAGSGEEVTLRVSRRVRRHDKVFRLEEG